MILLGKAGPFLNRHWFKLGLVLLVLYTLLSRDLSLNVSLHNPGEAPAQMAPPTQQTVKKSRETLTENGPGQSAKTELFDFWPSWGNNEVILLESLQQVPVNQIEAFVERFAHVAQAEAEKFAVPASIILANALLQSQAGQAKWAQEGHNFFALACTDDWEAGTQDGPGGCLRRYDNAWLSFRDHSLYLREGPHRRLRRLQHQDYRAWADALADTIGARQKDYAEQLQTVIARFQLTRYDEEA
jgi:flagellum-specific peptidoglycan hydrolase FlgJ